MISPLQTSRGSYKTKSMQTAKFFKNIFRKMPRKRYIFETVNVILKLNFVQINIRRYEILGELTTQIG